MKKRNIVFMLVALIVVYIISSYGTSFIIAEQKKPIVKEPKHVFGEYSFNINEISEKDKENYTEAIIMIDNSKGLTFNSFKEILLAINKIEDERIRMKLLERIELEKGFILKNDIEQLMYSVSPKFNSYDKYNLRVINTIMNYKDYNNFTDNDFINDELISQIIKEIDNKYILNIINSIV